MHRDLKPENLFVTHDGRVKILDFRLAKLKPQRNDVVSSEIETQKQITDPGTVMGTVGYISPEQVRGQDVDHRSDIFSFGSILYEMLSGQRAFRRETMAETMTAILKEDPPELSEARTKIAPSLERIVRRCLEKKPERRFQTASDLGFAIEYLSTQSDTRPPAQLETTAALPLVSFQVGPPLFPRQRQVLFDPVDVRLARYQIQAGRFKTLEEFGHSSNLGLGQETKPSQTAIKPYHLSYRVFSGKPVDHGVICVRNDVLDRSTRKLIRRRTRFISNNLNEKIK